MKRSKQQPAPRRQSAAKKNEQRFLVISLFVLVALLILWVLFAPGKGYYSYFMLKKEIAGLSEESIRLKQRNAELSQEIERLKTDDAYLESVARKKYGLLKKNERVYESSKAQTQKEEQ